VIATTAPTNTAARPRATRRNITRIVAKWEEQGATFKSTVMKGNEAMQKYVTLDGIAKVSGGGGGARRSTAEHGGVGRGRSSADAHSAWCGERYGTRSVCVGGERGHVRFKHHQHYEPHPLRSTTWCL